MVDVPTTHVAYVRPSVNVAQTFSGAVHIRRVLRAMGRALPCPAARQASDSVRAVIRWRDGRVTEVSARRPGVIEMIVDTPGGPLPALAYPRLVGEPTVGDRGLLNSGALDLGLGTGGFALVVAVPDRLPPAAAVRVPARPPPEGGGPGHVVKARYTPMQVTVLAVDEQDSPHHEALRDADDLG